MNHIRSYIKVSTEYYSLFDTIFEYLYLLSAHRKHAIECESILFRPTAKLCQPQLDSCEIVIEGYNDIPSLPLFYSIGWSKSRSRLAFKL